MLHRNPTAGLEIKVKAPPDGELEISRRNLPYKFHILKVGTPKFVIETSQLVELDNLLERKEIEPFLWRDFFCLYRKGASRVVMKLQDKFYRPSEFEFYIDGELNNFIFSKEVRQMKWNWLSNLRLVFNSALSRKAQFNLFRGTYHARLNRLRLKGGYFSALSISLGFRCSTSSSYDSFGYYGTLWASSGSQLVFPSTFISSEYHQVPESRSEYKRLLSGREKGFDGRSFYYKVHLEAYERLENFGK